MSFDVEFVYRDDEPCTITCNRCGNINEGEILLEEQKFLEDEERAQIRCDDCNVVLMQVWRDGAMRKESMSHNQIANAIGNLKGKISNVMTDEDVEKFKSDVTKLEKKFEER